MIYIITGKHGNGILGVLRYTYYTYIQLRTFNPYNLLSCLVFKINPSIQFGLALAVFSFGAIFLPCRTIRILYAGSLSSRVTILSKQLHTGNVFMLGEGWRVSCDRSGSLIYSLKKYRINVSFFFLSKILFLSFMDAK